MLLSVLLDMRFGEPPSALHPVVGMGRYLGLKIRLLALSPRASIRLLLGAAFVLLGAALCTALAWGIQGMLEPLPWFVALPLLALLLKPFFSVSALLKAGKVVGSALEAHNLPEARKLLSWHLVSRDTAQLSESEVAGAAVSSLAENLTDSIVAPLLYAALFGLPGIVLYRFINTADAVLGYRTANLEHFGKLAARADDALNFVPARLSALLLLASLKLTGREVIPAWRGLRRDHTLTPSPNGGWTMATVAHGLEIRLEKRGVYTLNAEGREPRAEDILAAQGLLAWTLALGLSLYALVLGIMAYA